MEIQIQITRTTTLTLLSALIGFLSILIHPFFSILFPLLLSCAHYFAYLPSLTKQTTFLIAITTFIFGSINGYTVLSLAQYQQWNCRTQIQNNQLSNETNYLPVFQIYLSLMTVYHYFQFQLINCFHHHTLCWQSFLIYHSPSYTVANAFMMLEHIITRYVFEFQYKLEHPFMLYALAVAILGQSLRISAFFTCKSNFTHLVSLQKKTNHELITNGVYSFFRHPSYTGYFYFCIFSQIFIGNIVSTCLYFIVLIKFFTQRIDDEQQALTNFFPTTYPNYKSNTHILIPFVKDPKLNYQAMDKKQ